MFRRQILFGSIASVLVSAAGLPAFAQDYADNLVRQLAKDGYGNIDVSRTLLGRLRIVADRAGGRREIIINPYTGEIMRDLWLVRANDTNRSEGSNRPRSASSDGPGTNGSDDNGSDDNGSGSGGSDDSGSGSDDSGGGGSGSDDSGSDDSEPDDSDNSGSGSSGSGGSGSGGDDKSDDKDDDRSGKGGKDD